MGRDSATYYLSSTAFLDLLGSLASNSGQLWFLFHADPLVIILCSE